MPSEQAAFEARGDFAGAAAAAPARGIYAFPSTGAMISEFTRCIGRFSALSRRRPRDALFTFACHDTDAERNMSLSLTPFH